MHLVNSKLKLRLSEEEVKQLNSYERVMKTMRHEEPDCVPIAELVVAEKVYKALMPEAACEHDFHASHLDVVTARNYYNKGPSGDGRLLDEWGITYLISPEQVHLPVGITISLEGDDCKTHPLPDPYAPQRFSELDYIVKNYKGEKAIGWAQRAFFLWSEALLSFEELFVGMKMEPEKIHILFDRILDYNIKMAVRAVEKGAEIVFETDDYAYNSGPFFGPSDFEEFVFPRMKKFVDAVHKAGAYVIKHTDGNIMPILPGIVECGFDGIHSIDPLAGMDIGEVKKLYGDKLVLFGNIEPGNLLGAGTPEEVTQVVQETIRKAGKSGGYIISTSNVIMSTVRPENYKAMLDTTREYGRYPLPL